MRSKVNIKYPIIITDGESDKYILKLYPFNKIFESDDYTEVVVIATSYILDQLVGYSSKGMTVAQFLQDFPPQKIADLQKLCNEGERVSIIDEEYDEDLQEFFETTMYFIRKICKN